jgi:hypothetical protein
LPRDAFEDADREEIQREMIRNMRGTCREEVQGLLTCGTMWAEISRHNSRETESKNKSILQLTETVSHEPIRNENAFQVPTSRSLGRKCIGSDPSNYALHAHDS